MTIFLYFCLAVFGLTVIAAAWQVFRARRFREIEARKSHLSTTPPYGLRDKLMSRILERRLDE